MSGALSGIGLLSDLESTFFPLEPPWTEGVTARRVGAGRVILFLSSISPTSSVSSFVSTPSRWSKVKSVNESPALVTMVSDAFMLPDVSALTLLDFLLGGGGGSPDGRFLSNRFGTGT